MPIYIYETQLETTGDILMLAQGYADEFELSKYRFIKNKKQEKFSCVYTIRFEIKATDFRDALEIANKEMRTLEDALAFYYSMPFIWLWWNWSLAKQGDKLPRILLSVYRKVPGVVMDSHENAPSKAIEKIIGLINRDSKFGNTLYFYNSLTRLDTLELGRAHLPVMFQLVESTADKEEVPLCEKCKKSGYSRTSHKHLRSILGEQLHKELYSHRGAGNDTVRNAIMHGNPNYSSPKPIGHGHIEEVLKKVRSKLIDEYELVDVEKAESRVDIDRFFYDREGTVLPVATVNNWSLEDYVNDFTENGIEGMTPEIMKISEPW